MSSRKPRRRPLRTSRRCARALYTSSSQHMHPQAGRNEGTRAVLLPMLCKNKQNCCTSGCSELVVSLILVLVSASAPFGTAAALPVVLGDDGRADALNLLVFLLDFLCVGLWVRVQPRLAVLQGVQDLLLLIRVHLLAEALVLARALRSRPHRVDVPIEGVLGVHTLLDFLIFIGELLRLLDPH